MQEKEAEPCDAKTVTLGIDLSVRTSRQIVILLLGVNNLLLRSLFYITLLRTDLSERSSFSGINSCVTVAKLPTKSRIREHG